MTVSKIILPYIDRKFTFQIATPTQDLSTAEDIVKYINPEASYSVIPGVENSSLLDTQKILLEVLPFTHNTMIDITMPFIELTKKKVVLKHYARYIICNKQLIGIRVKPSDNWPKSKSIKQSISPSLENFYQEQGITNYQKEIFVGEFIIKTAHFKIAPLFASELSTTFDNATVNLLNDYYSLGCEVFSVVNDLTEEKKKSLKDPYDILKNYRRESTVMLYCGMHMALDSIEIYKTKSYAIQSSKIMKKIHVTNLDQTYTDLLIGDFNRTKRLKIQDGFAETKLVDSEIEILDFSHLRIQFCNQSLSLNEINNFEEPMDIENSNEDVQENLSDQTLYLWHLYADINKKNPFILPCPLNDKDETLLKHILLLSTKSSIPETELIQFLKLDTKMKIPKKYEQKNFKSIFLERLTARETDKLYAYFSLRERIALNSIEKDEAFLSEVEKRIVNCSKCIKEEFFKSLENKISTEKASVPDEDEKFVEAFLEKKSEKSLETFYYEIAKYYPRNKIDPDFVQNMFECLQNKVKNEFLGNPFQKFILSTTFDEVRHIFAESEQKYFLKEPNEILKAEEEPNQGGGEAENESFRSYIKKIRYHCTVQKKNYYFCHICNSLFSKKEKASWGRLCISCNNFVCHSCFDIKTGETAQSEENFQQCLVCLNKCDCDKCTKKKVRLEPSLGQKPSMNRQSSSMFDNFQDFGGIDHLFPSETTEVKKSFIKSEMVLERESKSSLFNKNESEALNTDQQSIKPCWTCELSNRVNRIIKFECSSCKDIKCLSCEKFELPYRNWVLRGSVICNKCYENERENNSLKTEIKNLKGKNMALEHENTLLQREKMNSIMLQNNNSFAMSPLDQNNEFYPAIDIEPKQEKGGATPLFDRSATFGHQGKSSPIPFHGKENPSEHGSMASFGGDKPQKNDVSFSRPNEENSSLSGSVASKKSEPQKKQEKKRKNSSCSSVKSIRSENKSIASFQNKPSKALSNHSSQSIESGQYQDSSSSKNNYKPEPKKEWKKNYHQESFDEERVYDISRGAHRGRGRGRGGNHNESFDSRDRNKSWGSSKKIENWDENRNEYQNNKREGYQNKRYQNNDSNKNWGSKNYNNDKQSERYDNKDNYKRQEENKPKEDNEEGNYYLGKIGSKVTDNDDDVDY